VAKGMSFARPLGCNFSEEFVMRVSLALLAAVFVFTGCNASDNVLSPPARPGFQLSGCEETRPQGAAEPNGGGDPLPSDCTVDSQDAESENNQVGSFYGSGGSYYPEFNGQSFGFDDVAGSPSSYSSCPDVLENIQFRRIIDGGIEVFQTIGPAYKIGPLEPMSDGLSRARYNLPSEFVYSRSGRHYAYAGTASVVCVNSFFGFSAGGVAGYVGVISYIAYNYDGVITRAGISGSPETSGWTYYLSGSGFANGNNEGWANALNGYIASGACSPYWDVWVDGKQVCRNGQPFDQS